MQRSSRPHSFAFTLLEIMIVVAILADVVLIALPSFIRARNLSQNSHFINDLRTASGAFEMYAAEHGRYPADSPASVTPAGMEVYLNGMPWEALNALSGTWDWQPNVDGAVAQIYTRLPAANDARMVDVDERMDNGVLTTGNFRRRAGTAYSFVIEF